MKKSLSALYQNTKYEAIDKKEEIVKVIEPEKVEIKNTIDKVKFCSSYYLHVNEPNPFNLNFAQLWHYGGV